MYSCNQKETVYIDVPVLMEGFDYYVEFEASYQERLNSSKILLDSILIDLSKLEREIASSGDDSNEELFEQKKSHYFQLKENNSNALDEFYSAEMQKISTRLNSYINDFGIENEYKYILGAGGQGVMLYADTSLNITNQVLLYANRKYAGF